MAKIKLSISGPLKQVKSQETYKSSTKLQIKSHFNSQLIVKIIANK